MRIDRLFLFPSFLLLWGSLEFALITNAYPRLLLIESCPSGCDLSYSNIVREIFFSLILFSPSPSSSILSSQNMSRLNDLIRSIMATSNVNQVCRDDRSDSFLAELTGRASSSGELLDEVVELFNVRKASRHSPLMFFILRLDASFSPSPLPLIECRWDLSNSC